MSTLIIVESPTKAKTLSKFLGNDYRIEATMGHVRDLPENRLGVTIEPGGTGYTFVPLYQPIKDRKIRIADLKKAASVSEKIILATDPDREGEAIAFHVKDVLAQNPKSKLKTPEFSRIVFHEITKTAIEQAVAHPREIDLQLVDAQQARRILDRLVGYKLSPLLWNKLGKRWLSAGRVQSVAVRLIVERERDIEKFVPVEYWLIEVELQKSVNGQAIADGKFLARLTEVAGKKAEIGNKESAETVIAELRNAAYKITGVDTKEVRRNPYPPFTTSTLQQAAANKYSWTAKRTMRAAQNLYEEGYITYHRTDSTNLSAEALNLARSLIPDLFGPSYLPDAARVYKTKSKVAQEAHEAIRPTDMKLIGSLDLKRFTTGKIESIGLHTLPVELGRDADLLYSLIWKRFLACQMKEALFDQTAVIISAGPNKLRAGGQVMKFDGWLAVYDGLKNQEQDQTEEENGRLPLLSVGEEPSFIQIIPQQKFTEPPPRFNEASLIKALEEKGIGRPSTYAPIISTIQDRKYVEKLERKFHPTDLGKTVSDFLVKYFSDIFDVSFTARMEDELDDVANGERAWMQVLTDFYAPFSTKLDEVFKTADRVKMDLGTTDEKCPNCGSPLAIRISKFGKFLACSTYPACKFTKNIIEKVGINCPRCGGEMVLKRTRRGKQFYGCGNYPTCNFAAWKKEDIKPEIPKIQIPTTPAGGQNQK